MNEKQKHQYMPFLFNSLSSSFMFHRKKSLSLCKSNQIIEINIKILRERIYHSLCGGGASDLRERSRRKGRGSVFAAETGGWFECGGRSCCMHGGVAVTNDFSWWRVWSALSFRQW
ncbi:unnamed protein product [Vicia faba]|uniref:Uncharacterized protein n=1 Tax=Vicia faba TaxID=3906 RepID=A0AAV0YNJ5_VICFA|nr:unnamed protein product [Vicia faba]